MESPFDGKGKGSLRPPLFQQDFLIHAD